jgi:uncharacterized membrane protein
LQPSEEFVPSWMPGSRSTELECIHVLFARRDAGTSFAGVLTVSRLERRMTTRVTIAGHPVHAMLVTIPIGLWVFTLTSDVVFAVTGDSRWEATAFFTLAGGIAGALLAAVPGLFDLLGLHEPQERRVGIIHMSLNLAIVVVQVINFALRVPSQTGTNLTFVLSALAVAALLVSGWLGGQLVHVFGVTQPGHASSQSAQHDRLHPRT